MAAAKKKSPVKKQKTSATKKVTKQTSSKKAVKVKAPAAKKTKVQVKTEVKKKITKIKIEVKAKSRPNVKTKAKAKKTVVRPSKKKIAPQKKGVARKPEKKVIAAKKSAAKKKVIAPVADRFLGLKSMLIAKRNALLKEAKLELQKYVSGENRQLVDTAIDEADWAAVEISEDINLKRLSAQRQHLKDVEECLRKLNEGTYGICEDCAEEISEKRLKVLPTASLCIDCKEQREKMAFLDQDTEL